MKAARSAVNAIANPQVPEVGERYLGTVVKTMSFGAFVSLTPGKDGLLHISELRKLNDGKRVEGVEDVVSVGQKVQVEITKIDDRGILISEVGLTLYDFFGRHFRSMPRHSVMLGRKVHRSLPDIRRDVRALHTYYDAAISQAERLGFSEGVEELPPEVRLFQRSGPEVDLCCRFTGERGKADAEAVSEKGPGGLFDAIGSLVGPGVSRAFRQQGPRRFVSGRGV